MGDWRKSTYSNGTGGDCIEVAGTSGQIGVRDTKQALFGNARTVLTFTPNAWQKFTASLR
jgi:hypothetical protein